MNWIFYLLATLAGAANPAQAAANAELKKTIGQVLAATLIVYLSGFIGVAVIYVASRQAFPASEKWAAVPWWAWTGGLISIGATLAGAAFAQKMGSGVFTGLSVTAALIVSLVLDNYGWMGFKVHPASWPRLLGGSLMIAGLWLMTKS